ncbi:MAG: hypothetical protein ACRDSJ_00380 [Rubrobacteraceae bacterium]
MNLEALYGGSFVNWKAVAESWGKRTVSSRLLLFASRRYLQESAAEPYSERLEIIRQTGLSDEIKRAFASPPEPESEAAARWGEFIDAALGAELEIVSYGERPPVLAEIRTGLQSAAEEAGKETPLGRWLLDRRDALPGTDLPDDPGYMPI